MSATRIQTADEHRFLEEASASNLADANFEPLEEEFRPGAQSQATAVILLVTSAFVIVFVAVLLGWQYGAFLAVALAAKIVIARIEAGRGKDDVSRDHENQYIVA